VYCQLVEICGCIPARIRHALADLPETLDETYERTLREINKANRGFAHRLFQFVAVAVRPLRVQELAELLAFDFEAGPIPEFHEDWRLEDPIHAVLSTCRSFLAIVDDSIHYIPCRVVQFSHFSVKEFLTSARLAEANDIIIRHYHISETPAHTLAARACLGYLLRLDTDVTSDTLQKLPFTEYSAEYWVDHARLEDVSRNVKNGLNDLFDPSKPHLAVCIWISDPSLPSWERRPQSKRPSPLLGTPLHYATLWGLHSNVELLINEHSQNVNSQDFTGSATPLHVASKRGPLEVARMLIERGAGVSAQNEDGQTPLHMVSLSDRVPFSGTSSHPKVVGMLTERGAAVSAQDKDGQTPLHLASQAGQLEVARILIEGSADVSAQNRDGRTPLHMVSLNDWVPMFGTSSHPEVAGMLIERGAAVSAQDKDGQTPLHLASQAGQLEVARILIERGADVSAQNEDGRTPLHMVSLSDWVPILGTSNLGHPEVAGMLIERGADVSAQDKDGQTPLHLAPQADQLEVARILIERGADVSAQDKNGETPLHLASQEGKLEAARMLVERGASVSAQNKDGQTPLRLASRAGKLEVACMQIERGVSGQTP
jgi:ankyrin repeat protein